MDPVVQRHLVKTVIIAVGVAVTYCLPMIIAMSYGHRRHQAITKLNILLGWTVLGWLVALAWSWPPRWHYRSRHQHDRRQTASWKERKARHAVRVCAVDGALLPLTQFHVVRRADARAARSLARSLGTFWPTSLDVGLKEFLEQSRA